MTAEEKILLAKDAALKAIAGRDQSRREIELVLAKKRFNSSIVAATVAELEAMGLIDDRKLAEHLVGRRLEEERTSRRELEAMLEGRGIEPGVIDAVLCEAFEDRDEEEDVLELARKRVRTSPAKLSPDAVQRRVYAYLARRGYDEEMCRWAVEKAAEEYLGRA